MYDSCVQWYAQTYEQFLQFTVGLGFVCLLSFSILCFSVLA